MNVEGVFLKAGYRQRHPVDGDRSLLDQIAPEPGRYRIANAHEVAFLAQIELLGDGIYVPLNEVAAEAGVRGPRPRHV